MSIDAAGARWAWSLGRAQIVNPFREDTPQYACWRAGVEGRPFPSTLVPTKNEDPA